MTPATMTMAMLIWMTTTIERGPLRKPSQMLDPRDVRRVDCQSVEVVSRRFEVVGPAEEDEVSARSVRRCFMDPSILTLVMSVVCIVSRSFRYIILCSRLRCSTYTLLVPRCAFLSNLYYPPRPMTCVPFLLSFHTIKRSVICQFHTIHTSSRDALFVGE